MTAPGVRVFVQLGVGSLVAFPERVYPKLELWRLITFPVVVGDIVTLLFGLSFQGVDEIWRRDE